MITTNIAKSDAKYEFKGHSVSILSSVKKMLENRSLCDVVLNVGIRQFHVHRIILAASSAYFEAMFTGALQESTQKEINLKGAKSETVQTLIDCMYESTITVTEENAISVLRLAANWQMDKIVQVCGEFISTRLDTENCLEMLSFADVHGCGVLKEAALKFTIDHFSDICRTEAFVDTPGEILTELLKSENLKIQSEEQLLDDILKWFNHRPKTRRDDTLKMLKLIKFPLIPWEILQEKLICNNFDTVYDCNMMLTNARNYQMHPDVVADYNLDDALYVPRRSLGQKKLIYVVGGEIYPSRNTVASVEQFDPRADQWSELSSMPSARRGTGVCILQGLLYAIGGSNGVIALRLVECYDPQTNRWSKLNDLLEERSSVGAGVIDGHLYAVGGYDGVSSCLQSVERYDPEAKQWFLVAPLNIPRSMMAIATDNTKMYAIGGYDGSSDLASCEVYNSLTNQWSFISTMNVPRCIPGACVVGGMLYAVGGCDRSMSLNSTEVYHPETDTWTMILGMSKPRSGVGVASVQGRIYAIGGYTGTEFCRSVECYDPQTRKWHFMSSMKTGRKRFGCCS